MSDIKDRTCESYRTCHLYSLLTCEKQSAITVTQKNLPALEQAPDDRGISSMNGISTAEEASSPCFWLPRLAPVLTLTTETGFRKLWAVLDLNQ